jgi:TolB-like protein
MPSPPRRSGTRLVVLLVGACALAVGSFWLGRPASPPSAIGNVHSIAILAFHSIGTDEGGRDLGVSLSDSIIRRLDSLESVSVRPGTVAREFGQAARDPIAAGRSLGVDAVLDGQLREAEGRLRVRVVLIGVRTGAPLWSGRFEGHRAELSRLGDAIADALAREVAAGPSGGRRRLAPARPTTP